MAQKYRFEGVPSTVTIGVPNKKALERVIRKLEANGIPHVQFSEPDFDMGLSSVATIPLLGADRDPVRNYALWRDPREPKSEDKIPYIKEVLHD